MDLPHVIDISDIKFKVLMRYVDSLDAGSTICFRLFRLSIAELFVLPVCGVR